MSYLTGIDVGSTTIKAIIYDPDGVLITSGSWQYLRGQRSNVRGFKLSVP